MKRRSKIGLLGRAVLLAGVMAAGGVGSDLVVPSAQAVVGRPLTPLSYAGVARRTTRRTAYYGGAAYGAYRPYAAYGAPYARTVTALPAGCTRVIVGGMARYSCAGASYQPYYDGPNLVYVPAH